MGWVGGRERRPFTSPAALAEAGLELGCRLVAELVGGPAIAERVPTGGHRSELVLRGVVAIRSVAGLHGPEGVAGHLRLGGLRGGGHCDADGGEEYRFHLSVTFSFSAAGELALCPEMALFRH